MPQAQFFFSERKPETFDDVLKGANDVRDTYKRRTLDELFAKHTDADGNLSPNFMKDATAAGLGRAEIEQAAQYRTGQKATTLRNAEIDADLRGRGYNPQAQGRNGAQYGDPQPVKISSPSMDGAMPPIGASTIDADKLRSPSEVGGVPQTASTGREATPAPANGAQGGKSMDQWWEWLNSGDKKKVAEAQKAIGAKADGVLGKDTAKAFFDAAHANGWKSWGGQEASAPNEVIVTAQGPVSKGEEGKLPPDTVGPDVFAPAQDNRSFDMRVEDSYDPSRDVSQRSLGGAEAPPAPDLTKASPADVAGLAEVLRRQLSYRGDDTAGPNMQAAFQKLWDSEWQNVAKREPVGWQTDANGKMDWNKTWQARHAWEAEKKAFPAMMAEKLQGLTKEGGLTYRGEQLAQQGTALGNKAKGNELARTTDSTLGVDSSIMDPAKLGEIRDRMGKWKTLASVAKRGGGEGPAGQESYRATVEKFGQLAEGIAPTMEGSRLVQRISQQAGPWQSYLQDGKTVEGVRQYFLAQSMGSPAQRKAALDEMLGTLRESIANDAEVYSARNGAMVAKNARNALKFDGVHGGGAPGAKPAPSGWERGPDGILRRAK